MSVSYWLHGISIAILIVNGGILLYKVSRASEGKSFSIPVVVFVYLVVSVPFVLGSMSFVPFFENQISPNAPEITVLNTIAVYSILIDPAQLSQHVKGGRWWQRLRERQSARAGARQP